MSRNLPTAESSVLINRIRSSLDGLQQTGLALRVSVAAESKWEPTESGDQVLVRWICWNLEDENGDVTKPEFEVVSQEVTQQLLSEDLPRIFPDIRVIVDGDIDV